MTAVGADVPAGSEFGRAFRAAAVAELRRITRVPSFIVPTVVFPILFFAMFGLPNTRYYADGVNLGAYTLASYGAYAMMAIAISAFAVSIATERGLGWNRLLRVTPLTPAAYFGGKAVTAVVMGLFALGTLFLFGIVAGGIRLPFLVWVGLLAVLIVGMLPFVLLGIALGYLAGPHSAAPIANLVFLPLAFASGLFIPMRMLPSAIQQIAVYLPSYHLGQLGWTMLGGGDGRGILWHFGVLLAYSVPFATLAVLAYRREEGRTFG